MNWALDKLDTWQTGYSIPTDLSQPMDSLASGEYCLVYVSAASEAEAITIARALVEAKLAACVSIFPTTSIYTWQSQLCQDQEWQLLIKTKRSCLDSLSQQVAELHSYEVPELIATSIEAGSPPYLNWIDTTLCPG
jgi:periplasmic divalent cation tolerance protein